MEINLLPWREEIIAYNKKLLTRMILAALVLSGFVLIGVYHAFFSELSYTSSYTQALEEAKTNLVSNVKDYLKFKDTNAEVVTRIAVLKKLLQGRFQTILLLNEITEIMPKGIYITKLSRDGGQVELSAMANSNLLITQFLKAIEASRGLQTLSLKKVEKAENKGILMVQFDLSLGIKSSAPKEEKKAEEKKETPIDATKNVIKAKENRTKEIDDALGVKP